MNNDVHYIAALMNYGSLRDQIDTLYQFDFRCVNDLINSEYKLLYDKLVAQAVLETNCYDWLEPFEDARLEKNFRKIMALSLFSKDEKSKLRARQLMSEIIVKQCRNIYNEKIDDLFEEIDDYYFSERYYDNTAELDRIQRAKDIRAEQQQWNAQY